MEFIAAFARAYHCGPTLERCTRFSHCCSLDARPAQSLSCFVSGKISPPGMQKETARRIRLAMSPSLSFYLDLTRFAAALVVFLGHSWLVLFPTYPLHWPGPAAVIVFFVLSGFVIAYVTDGRDRTLADYTLNRLSRLWSVALPALGFGIVLFHFVGHSAFSPEPADPGTLLSTAANALFVGQAWFLDPAPPLNGPFWSLNYEAWYYAIFGAWVYLPRPTGALVATMLAILAGPKILLLMPCWLLGVLVYWNIERWRLSDRAAATLWACSLVSAVLLIKSAFGTTLHDRFLASWPKTATLLAYSGYPLTDYALALLVALNFYSAAHAHRLGGSCCRWRNPYGYSPHSP